MKRPLSEALLIVFLGITLALAVNGVRPKAIRLIHTDTPSAAETFDAETSLPMLTLVEARRRYDAPGVLFVDARGSALFEEGHIHGAVNLPLEKFDDRIGPFFEETPTNLGLIVYCDGEQCRQSRDLAQRLTDAGYSDVMVLADGWRPWVEHGYPTQGR